MMAAPFIPPPEVAFDIDGVIADTMTLFLEIAKEDYAIDGLVMADITSYDLEECLGIDAGILNEITSKILDGRYRFPLKTMPGADQVLARMAKSHSPILFVTARPYPGPMDGWLTDSLGLGSKQVELVTTGTYEGKADILVDRGISYFVEDRIETCFHLHEVGVTPIVFKQPWNRQPHNFIEVCDWKALGDLIDMIGIDYS